MPQYEFVCQKCHKQFSKFLGISEYLKEKNGIKCPRCGSKRSERRWSAVYAITSKKS